MGIDLSYWRCKEGADLSPGEVYQRACCDGLPAEGLEELPVAAILAEVEAAYGKWQRMDRNTWEKETGGGFQLFTTPQIFRVDCYGLPREEGARCSERMKRYGCPVYDPQQGCRFDRLEVSLMGEASVCREAVEEALADLFPGLPAAIREVPVPEGPVTLPKPEHPALELFLHRGKNAANITANLFFGSGWASRPTQCKLALLTTPEETQKRFSKLARTVISRVAEDMRQRSYYR